MTASFSSTRRTLRRFFVAAPLVLATAGVWAEELKIEASLVWGTNDDKPVAPGADGKPSDKKLTPVSHEMAKKLGNIFKWKHYYEVNKIAGAVPSRGTNTFTMSKDCTIRITELAGPKVKVALIGKGKPVNETTENLEKGGCFTIGGPDKNHTAWFVVVKQL